MNNIIKQGSLERTIQSEEGDIFKKTSIVEILAGPSSEGIYEVYPVKAFDQNNNPFVTNDGKVYSLKLSLNPADGDFKPLDRPVKTASLAFSTPGFNMEDFVKEDDAVTLALRDAWQSKGFTVDKDGYVIDKMGIKGMRVIDPSSINDEKDVRYWVKEKVVQGMKKTAILQIADFFFDDQWQDITKKAVSEYMIEDEDRSLTKKEPKGQGKMKPYPGSDTSNKKMDYEMQGELEGKSNKAGNGGKDSPWQSQSDKTPQGTSKKQMGKYPNKQDVKETRGIPEWIPTDKKSSTSQLLQKIAYLRHRFNLSKIAVDGEEELTKGKTPTHVEGQPAEAETQVKKEDKPKEG